MAIPSEYVEEKKIQEMVKVMLETEFSGEERYKRRIEKLNLTGGCGDGCCEVEEEK